MEDMKTEDLAIRDLSIEISQLLEHIHEVLTRLYISIKQRAVRTGIRLLMVLMLLLLAIFIYVSFYCAFMPRTNLTTHVHFHFRSDLVCSHLVANVSFLQNNIKQIMDPGQPYQITLEMEMPESPVNMQLGMFMVKMSCYSYNEENVDSSVRSTMLHYRSCLLQTLETLVLLPLLLIGANEQKQKVLVELYSSYIESIDKPTVGAVIEIQSQQIQIYGAKLHIHAHFSGIRYVFHHFPLTSAVVGVTSNLICLIMIFRKSSHGLVIWLNQQCGKCNEVIQNRTGLHEGTKYYKRSAHEEE